MVMDWRQTPMCPCLPAVGRAMFGMSVGDDLAKEKFKELVDDHLKALTDMFLKDAKFIYSDTPTIADLAVALPLNYIKARGELWGALPEKVKEHQKAALEAFPETADKLASLNKWATGFDGEGSDLLSP